MLSGQSGGWLLDGDCVWLRPAPALDASRAPALGHWFASLPAAPQMRNHSREDYHEYWILNYLKEPGDRLHLASPMGFPPDSPVLRSWLEKIEAWVTSTRRVRYEDSFKVLTQVIRTQGLEGAIADVDAASCIGPQERDRPLQALSAGRYDCDVIFRAMAINNFWQTSKLVDEDEANRRAAAVPEPGSIWAEVLRRALPAPTRRLRSKRSCSDEAMARDDGHFPQEVACPRELSAVTHAKRQALSANVDAASCNTRSIGTVGTL